VQLRVEARAAEGFETRWPDCGTKTAVASPLLEGLAEVYAAEEQRPAPAPNVGGGGDVERVLRR
jgi:hypothetical protein